jgi:hypothetical protein
MGSTLLAAHGFYSKSATEIWEKIAGSNKPVVILSPDRRSRVSAVYVEDRHGDEHVDLDVDGDIGTLHLNIGHGVGSELLWAQDSKAFFITTSDGGANGIYRLLVVDTFDGKLASRDLTSLIVQAFGHPFLCGWPEPPNVAGIAWVGHTHRLWAAAEVVNHSVCDSNGTFIAYEFDPAAMKIALTLNQIQAKHQLDATLGPELKRAPDHCILEPSSCFVRTNHSELAAHLTQ